MIYCIESFEYIKENSHGEFILIHIFTKASVIHSFKNFSSTSSSPLLLRGAPNSSTVKNKSFKMIIECVGKRPRKEAQLKREAILYRGAINTKSKGLHESGTSKRD